MIYSGDYTFARAYRTRQEDREGAHAKRNTNLCTDMDRSENGKKK